MYASRELTHPDCTAAIEQVCPGGLRATRQGDDPFNPVPQGSGLCGNHRYRGFYPPVVRRLAVPNTVSATLFWLPLEGRRDDGTTGRACAFLLAGAVFLALVCRHHLNYNLPDYPHKRRAQGHQGTINLGINLNLELQQRC